MLMEIKYLKGVICDSINLIEFSRDLEEILDGKYMWVYPPNPFVF